MTHAPHFARGRWGKALSPQKWSQQKINSKENREHDRCRSIECRADTTNASRKHRQRGKWSWKHIPRSSNPFWWTLPQHMLKTSHAPVKKGIHYKPFRSRKTQCEVRRRNREDHWRRFTESRAKNTNCFWESRWREGLEWKRENALDRMDVTLN